MDDVSILATIGGAMFLKDSRTSCLVRPQTILEAK